MELGIPSLQSGGAGARPSARRHIKQMNRGDWLTQRVEQSVKPGCLSHHTNYPTQNPRKSTCLSHSSALISILILCKKN